MNKKLIILSIFLAFLILRVLHINADPPSGLSFSAGIFVDEMHNVHQIRNKILFGSWKMDQWPSIAYSPIFAVLQYLILSVIGVGLWQIKVLPIILGLASLILVFKSFKEYFGDRSGLIAAVLLGLNYTFVMYNRLGLFENLVILFMALTLFFWQRSVRTEKPVYFFLTGFVAGLAFLAKSMAFHFVIATAFSFIFFIIKNGLKVSLKPAAAGLIGAGLAGILWYFGFYLPFEEDISNVGSSWLNMTFQSGGIGKLITANPVFHLFYRLKFLPLTLSLSILFIMAIGIKAIREPSKLDPVEIFLLFWSLCGAFFLSLLSYQPTRYYLPILPGIVLITAVGLTRLGDKRRLERPKYSGWRFYLISFLGVVVLLFYFIIPYIKKYYPFLTRNLLLDDFSRSGDFFVSAIVGILFASMMGWAVHLKKSGHLTPKVLFSFLFLLSYILVFFMSHPFAAQIAVELTSAPKDKMRFYWSDSPGNYTETNSNGVHIRKGSGTYSQTIGSLYSINYLRIDPIRKKGTVFINKISITQPGFETMVFKTREQFKQFVPLRHIEEMVVQNEGLKVKSMGHDPNFYIKLSPAFKTTSFLRYLFAVFIYVSGIVLVCYFLFKSAQWINKTDFLAGFREKYLRIPIIVNLVIVLIVAINMFYYSSWFLKANYAVYNTSKEIGELLPPDALIAGQGVMAATIQNKIRHVQAPNWFEDKPKLFFNYPITHLFLSYYAGYLGWFKAHYPGVMKHAKVIGKYRILNIDFFLFEIDVPSDMREKAFKYR